MASSTFEVVPAVEADMGDIGSIFTVSFADDHILGPANCKVALDLLRAADLEFINELWRTREAFNARFFKVIDLDTRSEPELISCLLLPILFFSFLSLSVFLFFLHVFNFCATIWVMRDLLKRHLHIHEISLAKQMDMMKTKKLSQFSTSKTIAFSKWNYPNPSTLHQGTGLKKTSYPQGANVELLDDFYAQMWSKRAKWMNPANTFCTSLFFLFLLQ